MGHQKERVLNTQKTRGSSAKKKKKKKERTKEEKGRFQLKVNFDAGEKKGEKKMSRPQSLPGGGRND